jgi:FHS family L-fucose permease-like MFS transporter
MAMVTTLFFAWGFLTCLNDILIPHLKNIFDLNYAEVMLVQFAFFSSYFVFSMPSGKIVEWFGYKRAMMIGLLTMATGAILFVPAASIPSFPLFLAALIVLAAGMTVLQTSANPYVTILGPPRTASSRLNLTQAFNSFGTTIAPWFGSILILGAAIAPLSVEAMHAMNADQLHAYRIQQAASVKVPYIGLAIALAVLAAIIGLFKLPVIESAEAHGHATGSVWKHPRLVLGAVAIFVYVGAEVSIGSLMTNYLNQKDIGNLSLQSAAGYLQYYWGGAMVGRFIGSALLQKISTYKLLAFNAVMSALLVAISMLTFGHTAMWSLILVGLFNSIMFPSIWPADRKRLRASRGGHRRWSNHSGTAGHSGGPHRNPSCFHPSSTLLRIYPFLRRAGGLERRPCCLACSRSGLTSNQSPARHKGPIPAMME